MAKRSREEIDHYVLDQFEQEKHLGIGHEMTKNLGHDWREREIEKNPAGRMVDYTNNDIGSDLVRGPPRSQGVYQKFTDPKSGISTNQQNLDRWSDYARSNSYTGHHHKAGPGVAPTMPDPRERSATGYRPNASEKSDGYLESTKGWAGYDRGSESGEGRLQKARKY